MRLDCLLDPLWNAFRKITDHCLPAEIAADRDARNRARMFLLSHVFGPPLGLSVPLALYAFDPTPGYEIAVLTAGILAFWAFPFVLRHGMPYRWLVLLSILNLNFVIFWSCFHYGGLQSPTASWILIIPILAVFYTGGEIRQKSDPLFAIGISGVIFAACYLTFEPGPNDIPPAAMETLNATSAVAVTCYIAAMSIYYARIFDAGVDLENEVERRRLMAIEYQRAVETSIRATAAKSEFLARMSHELRSPLNAIIGYGEILRDEFESDPEALLAKDVERILEAGQYLTRLIGMILDLAKIESGKMTFDPRPHDIGALVEQVFERRRALIASKGNSFAVETPAEPVISTIDANRFRQIVDNIVSNAAKFTEGGRIDAVLRRAGGAGPPAFALTVRDSGCGISEDVLPMVFESFLMERHAAEGRYGGTGLALSVADRFCRAMNGSIAVESVVGEGTAFTVTLPLLPPVAPAASVPDPVAAAA